MNDTLANIFSRTSTRSFSGEPLMPAEESELVQALNQPVVFGSETRFRLIGPDLGGGRIGTYGVIRKAPAWVVGCVAESPLAFIDYGYAMEGIILAATALGLGTCWLGGIFGRTGAGRALDLRPGEIVPAVSPVGMPAARSTLADRVIRAAAGSSSRLPPSELFFDGQWDKPLEDAGDWALPLEAVRRGPSASNKQPWRILRTGSTVKPEFHLFLKENPLYTHAIPGVVLQDMDAGIALRHFEAAASSLSLPGRWLVDPRPPEAPDIRYIASWVE